MPDDKKWSVTTTVVGGDRKWGTRFEWVGSGYIFSLQVVLAPAVRIILFGWSLYFGRLLQVKTFGTNLNAIAESKGWKYSAPDK